MNVSLNSEGVHVSIPEFPYVRLLVIDVNGSVDARMSIRQLEHLKEDIDLILDAWNKKGEHHPTTNTTTDRVWCEKCKSTFNALFENGEYIKKWSQEECIPKVDE